MKKINVVLGATGRIGFCLCIELKNRGEYVRAFVRDNNIVAEKLKNIVDEIVYGDIRNYETLLSAFKNAEIVYHLAAVVSIESKTSPIINQTNIDGTRNVINACKECHTKRLVYTSSVHALDFQNNQQILVEQNKYFPEKVFGPYAKSKATAANLVLQATQDGLDAVIGLPSGVIGPYEYTESNFGQMIADVVERKLRVLIKGEYDFVDVRDVCNALCDLAMLGIKGECYIISGYKATIKELMQIASNVAKVKRPRISIPLWIIKLIAPIAEKRSLRKGNKPTFTPYAIKVLQDNCNFSHEKLTTLTGYNPRPIDESIKDQIEFYFQEIKGKI